MNSRVLAIPLLIKWQGIFLCAEIINKQLKLLLVVCLWVFTEKKKKSTGKQLQVVVSRVAHLPRPLLASLWGHGFAFYSVKMICLVVLRTTKVAKLLPFPTGRQEIFVPINTKLYIYINNPSTRF